MIVKDASGNPVSGVAVTFAVAPGSGTVTPTTVTTGGDGIAAATSWTLSTTAGTNTLTATASGLTGSPVTFTAQGTAGAAARLVLTTPPSATARSGAPLAQQPVVQLQDANGNPVNQAGVLVTATPSPAGATASNNTATTGPTGAATFSGLTLTGTAASYTLSFGGTGITPVSSGAIALSAGAAASIAANGGGTSAPAGTAVSPPPSVIVKDASGNLVAGVAVTFAASTGGSVTGANQTTGTDGIATVGSWTLAATAGANTLTATAAGLTGSPVTFTAQGTAGTATRLALTTPPPSTARSGAALAPQPVLQLQDANGNAVSAGNVVVTATPSPAGATASNNTATTTSNGVATFSGLTLTGTVGSYTLSFGATGLTPASSGPIALSAGDAASIAANGGGTSAPAGTAVTPPPSVIVRDASGNLVSGVAVTFTASSGGSVTGANPMTGADGIATVGSWTLAATAGANTLTATAAGSGISGNPVTFTATGTVGPVSATTSTVEAAPASIPAGSGTSTITVTARDAAGNPIGGAGVMLTATGGTGNTLAPATGTTDPTTGVLTATFSSTSAGAKSISAIINSVAITQTAPVTVTAGAATQIAANGQTSWTATVGTAVTPPPAVIVRDQFNNPVTGVAVTFAVTSGAGAVDPATVTTGSDGVATVRSWTVGLVPGNNTLAATASGLTGSPVTFTATGTVAPASSTQSRVTAQPATIPASTGSSASTLTVTALDAFGNPVPGATVALDASGTGNTLTQPAATTDATGQVTGALSSTRAETKTVTATLNGTLALVQTPTVVVLPGPATAFSFTVQPSNTVLLDRITPPVRVTAFDAFGNTAAGFADKVTLAIGTDPSLLGAHLGGTTTVPAVSGVAIFDDLSIDQLGRGYTLVASAPGINATSAPFNITLLP